MHSQRNRPTAERRVTVISWLLLSLALLGCSNGWNPLDPMDPPGGQEPPAVSEPPGEGSPPGGPSSPPGHVTPPGTLVVSVSGSAVVVASGYRVIIQVDGEIEPRTRVVIGPAVWNSVPPGTHSVRVEPLLGYCVAEGADRSFTIVAGETLGVEFPVSCAPDFGFLAGAYEREPDAGSIPGYLSERFELRSDGLFRLVYQTSDHSFAFDGEFYLLSESSGEPRLHLLFLPDGGRQWAAATLQGDCLVVAYNLHMALSDFSDGTFCRS